MAINMLMRKDQTQLRTMLPSCWRGIGFESVWETSVTFSLSVRLVRLVSFHRSVAPEESSHCCIEWAYVILLEDFCIFPSLPETYLLLNRVTSNERIQEVVVASQPTVSLENTEHDTSSTHETHLRWRYPTKTHSSNLVHIRKLGWT